MTPPSTPPSPPQNNRIAVLIFGLDCADKPLLVPLTTSLYVPGKLASSEHVLVDVGTGFYVEKSLKDATKFYNGKVEELGANLKDLEQIMQGKVNTVRVVESGEWALFPDR